MQMSEADARSLKHAGVDSLRRGEPIKARETFERLAAAGHADALVWLGLAAACRGLKDQAAMVAAVDKVLALEPRNVRALILKGDHLAGAGDVPSALSFYRAAMKSAATAGQMPPDLAREVARAQEDCDRFAKDYEEFLRRRLAEHGLNERSSLRFAMSLDLLHGKKELFHQQPRHYYFPELPQKQFYERSQFPWLNAIEAATPEIRREAEEALKDATAFSPYVTREHKERRPHSGQQGMLDNPDWSAFFLWKDGHPVPPNTARCPKTTNAVLENAPLSRAADRMPSILFSLLRPAARIPPHTGLLNSRLICHLPLIVPANCGFRVGNDVREWVEGEAFVFDDTMEHEAWNSSERLRVVLIFEIWRPELTAEERMLVQVMLEATDAYGSAKTKWDA